VQTDFRIGKCTRKCAVSGQPLEPGQDFYSVVLGDEELLIRQDISASAWTGPPPGAVGWWKVKMPEAAAKKLQPAPLGVLLDTLTELLERPGAESMAYLLALLLCRRRVLINEDSPDLEVEKNESDSTLQLSYPPDGRRWTVPVAVPAPNLLEGLQSQLNSLLFIEI
jgi:hypothetical protein